MGPMGVFDTLQALRTEDTSGEFSYAVVRGAYTRDDGGGGFFDWEWTSRAADDNFTVIYNQQRSITIGDGRWVRTAQDTPQTIVSSGGVVQVNCANGTFVLLTLSENTTIAAPTHPFAGVELQFLISQPALTHYTVAWNAVFKLTEPFSVSPGKSSSARFIYSGSAWYQVGGFVLDG